MSQVVFATPVRVAATKRMACALKGTWHPIKRGTLLKVRRHLEF